jgi:chitinase
MDETAFLNLLKMTVENHGCSIVDLDLERRIINLDGPDEVVDACARAIAEFARE